MSTLCGTEGIRFGVVGAEKNLSQMPAIPCSHNSSHESPGPYYTTKNFGLKIGLMSNSKVGVTLQTWTFRSDYPLFLPTSPPGKGERPGRERGSRLQKLQFSYFPAIFVV